MFGDIPQRQSLFTIFVLVREPLIRPSGADLRPQKRAIRNVYPQRCQPASECSLSQED